MKAFSISVNWTKWLPTHDLVDYIWCCYCSVASIVVRAKYPAILDAKRLTSRPGLSTYVPEWIKKDNKRFPRAILRRAGRRVETSGILSLFGDHLVDIEIRALGSFMQHARAIDEKHSTVVVIQAEKEVSVLGDSRDANRHAHECLAESVPAVLCKSLHQ